MSEAQRRRVSGLFDWKDSCSDAMSAARALYHGGQGGADGAVDRFEYEEIRATAGGDQGVDPATFPRPGDDVPNPNSDLSCDPRYLRLTCGALPVNQSVKQRYGLPVGCVVRPLIPGENVPVAQFGSSGIVRCRRCRTC